MMSANTFATTTLLLITTTAQTTTFLLVPGTQRFAAKGEVIVFDDGRLNPCVGGRVDEVIGR